MFTSLAHKVFGSPNDRILKGFRRTVEEINALEPQIQALDDQQLNAQTAKFRAALANGTELDDLLPEAFATVREASRRVRNERHFDVQLMGGMALHEGYIPEMRTGEGKTLTATLAMYLNALAGKGVHVVTVNDYLVKVGAAWNRPIFDLLGMSIGCIFSNLSDTERKAAYAADITYGTNNEFGFDYLRDNMKFRAEEMVHRPFHYAIVDEVDSILIDEARTPLIISGALEDSSEMYRSVDRVIPKLVAADYEIDEKHKQVFLTEAGNEHAEKILQELGILSEGGLYDAQNLTIVHHVNQALRAHKLFKRDVDYIVKDGAVIIIDEFTGRMMEGRRFSEGLHQALEAKENANIQNENQTLASITFQNYFRMYPKLAGMTGTALTEAAEFEGIYNLRVVEIPTNKPMIRQDQHDVIYRTVREKYEAIVKLVQECQARQQPVLVGTTSIEKSETLAALLKKKGIPHNVLNARYHEQEAHIIAQAGKPGAVTIATNMAGRGTDIKLGGNAEMRIEEEGAENAEKIKAEVAEAYEIVKQAGGLFVIGSERHESRRIDNQLRGRSGRQGDPGASKFFISIEDDLMRIFGLDKHMGGVLGSLPEGEALQHRWLNTAIESAQKKVEAQHFEMRKNLLKFDNVMNDQRRVIYEQRREIMTTEDVSDTVIGMRHEVIDTLVASAIPDNSYPEQWDTELLASGALRLLGLAVPAAEWAQEDGISAELVAERVKAEIDALMQKREAVVSPAVMRQIEKAVLLQLLDQLWKEHLLNLEYVRQGIHWRGVGQKDPLNEYRTEAFGLFQGMLDTLREKVTSDLCHIDLRAESAPPPLPEAPAPEKITTNHGIDDLETWSRTPRNAPCPCGSGKKYKYCHGAAP